MSKKDKTDDLDAAQKDKAEDEIARVDERRFSMQLQDLVAEAEEMRIKRMRQHRTRGFIAMNFAIFALTLGAAGFGWYFLMHLNIGMSVLCVLIPMVLSILVYMWAALPIKTYKREHKTVFMPKLAKALSGLNYQHQRGINTKILDKTGVLPAHNRLNCEDCFMGTYKGVKVIFSEARLYANTKRDGPVFQGIFVLLETAGDVIEGHTVISADTKMVQTSAKSRWKNMSRVYITPSNPEWDIFQVYSNKPESAELIVGDRLLKELAEAAAIFNNAALTAVLIGKKYVFMMIPNDKDMFEASDLFVPVTTNQHALNCKKEIEQILEIIDVFDLYQPLKS